MSNVLERPVGLVSAAGITCAFSLFLLVCDTAKRRVVVEAEIASVDDVVGFGVVCKVVQLPQVSLSWSALLVTWLHSISLGSLTSNIGNAEDASMADLLHATLVGFEGTSTRHRTAGLGRAAIGQVGLRVGARLRRWLLHSE